MEALRALRANTVVAENSPGTIDIYLNVVSPRRRRDGTKLAGLKITLRQGYLIGIQSRAQCKRDIAWKFHDGEPAQRVCDRMLAAACAKSS
jgi:hypothetical protein